MKTPTTPPNTPKAINRRYQRRTARWWTAVIALAGCAVWSSILLLEFLSPTKSSDFLIQTAKDRRDRMWLMLPLDLLRMSGLGDHAIEFTLVLVFITTALSASILAYLLFRLAPEGYWGRQRKNPAE